MGGECLQSGIFKEKNHPSFFLGREGGEAACGWGEVCEVLRESWGGFPYCGFCSLLEVEGASSPVSGVGCG